MINQNPAGEGIPVAETMENEQALMEEQVAAQATPIEGDEQLIAGQQPEPMIQEGHQEAGLGRGFREAGKVVSEAWHGSPRAPVDRVNDEAIKEMEQIMGKVGDFADPTAVDVTRWSTEYIDDVKDITDVLQGTHAGWDFENNHPALSVQSHQETLDKAAAMPEDEFAKKVLGYKANDAWNSQEITRGRQMMLKVAAEIYEYAQDIGEEYTDAYGRKDWRLKTDDSEKLFEFHRKLNTLAAIQYAVSGAISEAGRSLNSMKIKVGSQMVDHDNLIDKYTRLGGEKSTKKLLQMVMSGDFLDMTKTARAVKYQGIAGRTWGVIKDLYYFGMLSGLSTHEKNAIGNAIVSLNGVQERYAAVVWGKLFTPAELAAQKIPVEKIRGWGIRSQEDKTQLDEVNDMAVATVSGYILAAKLLAKRSKEYAKTLRHDAADLFGQGDRYEAGADPVNVDIGHVAYDDAARIRGISSENLGLKPTTVAGKMVNFIGEHITGATGNALGVMDDAFKTIAYEQAVAYESRRLARKILGDDYNDPDKLYPLLKKMRENPEDIINESAIAFARKQTFTEELTSQIGKLAEQAKTVPLLNMFVPFVRTVSNITKYGAERVMPFAFPSWYADLAAGGARRDQAMARMSTGAIMAGMANLMFMGETKEVTDPETGKTVTLHMPNITGALSSNPSVKRLQRQAGMVPFSIKDPETGKYTPYQWMEPFGTMLGAIASTLEVYHNTYDDNAKEEIETALVMGLTEYTMDKSYLMGFADLMDILQGNKSVKDWTANFAATITMPRAAAQFRKDADDVIRGNKAGGWLQTYVDSWKNKSPWFSEDVAPYIDTWGNEMRYGDPMWKYHWLSPAITNTVAQDPVTKELARLYKPNQDDMSRFSVTKPTPMIDWAVMDPQFPKDLSRATKLKIDLRKADETGWMYSDYQKLVGKIRRLQAEKLVNDPKWKEATTDQKYSMMRMAFNQGVSGARALIAMEQTPRAVQELLTPEIMELKNSFLNKYRDAIQLEAGRLQQRMGELQGGRFDYLETTEPVEIGGGKPSTHIKPEF